MKARVLTMLSLLVLSANPVAAQSPVNANKLFLTACGGDIDSNKKVISGFCVPLSTEQIVRAKAAAFPIAEAYAKTTVERFRMQSYRDWLVTTLNPKGLELVELAQATHERGNEEISNLVSRLDYSVRHIALKNGVSRVVVYGPVNAVSAAGDIQWHAGALSAS